MLFRTYKTSRSSVIIRLTCPNKMPILLTRLEEDFYYSVLQSCVYISITSEGNCSRIAVQFNLKIDGETQHVVSLFFIIISSSMFSVVAGIVIVKLFSFFLKKSRLSLISSLCAS